MSVTGAAVESVATTVESADVVPSEALLQAVTTPAIAKIANNFFIIVGFVLMAAKVMADRK